MAARWRTVGRLAVAVLVGTAVMLGPYRAEGQDPPIAVEESSVRSQFTDDVALQFRLRPDGRPTNVLNVADPSLIASASLTIQPGATFPWHTHPGPVLARVEQGDLVYMYADDCEPRLYSAGTVFVDPGYGNVHTAWNPSEHDVTVIHATFLDAPARTHQAPDGSGLTEPVAPQDAAALDEACEVSTPRAP